MKINQLLESANKESNAGMTGLMTKTAVIKNGIGSELKDILGWNCITKDKDGNCFSFYAAQPPLTGLTKPTPVVCPLGIVAFNKYKIDIEEAIKIFHSGNWGSDFVAIALSMVLHPNVTEPCWYFRSSLGSTIVIGANTGDVHESAPIVVKYGVPVE